MNRRTAEIVLVAVVAILVVSVAASTLDSTTSGSGLSSGGENGSSILSVPEVNTSGAVSDFSIPREPVIALLAVAFVVALWYALEHPGKTLAYMAAAVVVFGVLFLILLAIGELFGELSGSGNGGIVGGDAPSGRPGTDANGAVVGTQAIELVAVLLFGIVFVGVMLTISGRTLPGESVESEGGPTDVAEVARAAGRAADRIEADAPVDNEVYRAWQEMTESLEVSNPDSSTPREFAEAAIEAGMAPEDVHELTAVFEEVRYGNEEPTAEREERAIGALRRIESTYGNDAGA